MNKLDRRVQSISILWVLFLAVGAVPVNAQSQGSQGTQQTQGASAKGCVEYNPPSLESAPDHMKEAVKLGHDIMMDTRKYAGKYVGNQLSCNNCHFKGGITQGGKNGGLSLVGVATKYPKYRSREKYEVDLIVRTNNCFERSMNGKALPWNGKEMRGILSYYHWISKGLPIYEEIPWLGLEKIEGSHKPDKERGASLFSKQCSMCHGDHGQGTQMAPPLWGNQSFNDGAGMSKLEVFASFIRLNMPKGNPDLSVDQALDIADYATSQPRPRFTGGKP